jgi:hypothetical protein
VTSVDEVLMNPPRMTPWRWAALIGAGLVLVFAADAGWTVLECVLVGGAIVGAGWALRVVRRRRLLSAPGFDPWQQCPACGVWGAPLAQLCGDGSRWQMECAACGQLWFDPPQRTTGVVLGD